MSCPSVVVLLVLLLLLAHIGRASVFGHAPGFASSSEDGSTTTVRPTPDLWNWSGMCANSATGIGVVVGVGLFKAGPLSNLTNLVYSSFGDVPGFVSPTQGHIMYSCIYAQQKWIAVGRAGFFSSDAVVPDSPSAWTHHGAILSDLPGCWPGFDLFSMAYSPEQNRFVVVGVGCTATFQGNINGTGWVNASTAVFSIQGQGVVWASALNLWVAVGARNIFSSPDGITWTERSVFSGISVAFNPLPPMFVVVGRGLTTAPSPVGYSSDGISWTPVFFAGPSVYGRAVAFSRQLSRWFISTNDTTAPLYWSNTNGASWMPSTVSSMPPTIFATLAVLEPAQRTTELVGVVNVTGGGATVIQGNLVVDPSANIHIGPGGSLLVPNGTATLAGSVTVSVAASGQFAIVSAQSVSGSFASVTAVDACSGATVPSDVVSAPASGGQLATLSVVVTQPVCSGGLSKGAIIGIAVGCSCGFLLGAAVIVLSILFRRRRQAHYHAALKQTHTASLNSSNPALLALSAHSAMSSPDASEAESEGSRRSSVDLQTNSSAVSMPQMPIPGPTDNEL